MTVALAAALCLALGWALTSLGWAGLSSRRIDLLFRGSLAIGFGLGIFSVIFFLFRVLGGTHLLAVDLVMLALLWAAFGLRMRKRSSQAPLAAADNFAHGPVWFRASLGGAFAVALVAAVYSEVRQVLTHPHGNGWDAFAIWNLHARFLASPYWRDGFTPLLPWSHPDYPLLIPAAIAHFWSYLGNDDPRVPALIGMAFTFGTAALLFSALRVLRGRVHAMLAAIALLATPAFMEQGAWQYADVPLSFFMLAVIALLCLHEAALQDSQAAGGWLALAGLAAGFAAWTKNEGVLFLCAVIVARQLVRIRSRRSQAAPGIPFASALFLAGIAPCIMLVLYFKHSIAPPGDLFSDANSIASRLAQPSRYWAVLRWYAKELLRFGDWLAIPGTPLLAGLLLSAGQARRVRNQGERASFLALSLTLAGYFAIYVITPYDIYWHLRFSLGRLFLQLWPSTLFLAFLALGPDGPLEPVVSQ